MRTRRQEDTEDTACQTASLLALNMVYLELRLHLMIFFYFQFFYFYKTNINIKIQLSKYWLSNKINNIYKYQHLIQVYCPFISFDRSNNVMFPVKEFLQHDAGD